MTRLRPNLLNSAPATPYLDRLPSPLSPDQALYTHRHPSHPSPPLRTAPRDIYPAAPKTKGDVKYPPFENLDECSLAEVRRFQVNPFGHIQDTCRHIPYNSGKKDFCTKTGMESLEGVFISPSPAAEKLSQACGP
jgi:hypothetical protein